MMKKFFLTDSRFLWLSLLLMIIFFSSMGFLWHQADVIRESPCTICAKRMGEDILCTARGGATRNYGANGSVHTTIPKDRRSIKPEDLEFNISSTDNA